MTKVTFPSGSPKWCREYPAEPTHCSTYLGKGMGQCLAMMNNSEDYKENGCACWRREDEYKAACEKSIREALEFVEGDREVIRSMVMQKYGRDVGEGIKFFCPTPTAVYDVGVEVEEGYQWESQDGHWINTSIYGYKLYKKVGNVEMRTVARIVADKKPTCGQCGKELTLVRPGKHQCDNPVCEENKNPAEIERKSESALIETMLGKNSSLIHQEQMEQEIKAGLKSKPESEGAKG